MDMGGWVTRATFKRYAIDSIADQRAAADKIERARAEKLEAARTEFRTESGKKADEIQRKEDHGKLQVRPN
jgi:hypothetical protein